jgi:DNA-binding CsgD family transcriptional regulator/tetratricopeptide (TPR) repeat protein
MVLLGRRRERETVDRLLTAVRSGESRALTLVGEPGIGKTALLGHTIESACDFRVTRVVGVESEIEIAFAALHQLCAPMLDWLERLPRPQGDALETAFGRRAGDAPDRFLVGLAALSLLGEAAKERPLLCVIDDWQWLDRASAQVLAFVARRLAAESVALVAATRAARDELVGLPQLVVEGLHDDDARMLLASALHGPLDEHVRDRIVAETGGNPLALLELPRSLAPGELAGGFGLHDAMSLEIGIEEIFKRRLEPLSAPSRRLLVVAAAEPIGDPLLVWRAADRLGITVDAAAPAGETGFVEFGTRVRFRHPLARSAVYRAASLQERQEVHAALADVTDPSIDPDRRAWHRALAAAGPDEDVADELERSASRARARGGLAAAAAFLERATGLTFEPARRAQRALAAAQAKHLAGDSSTALRLLTIAQAGVLGPLESARVELLRAQIAFSVSRSGNAPPLLVRAAGRLEMLDVGLARETYLDALSGAIFAGRQIGASCDVLDVAAAVRSAPPPPGPPRASDLLLDGLALLVTEGYAVGGPALHRALREFRSDRLSQEEGLRWLWLAGRSAMALWDDESWHALAGRHVQLVRDAGALALLPVALSSWITLHLYAGELDSAASLIEEATEVTDATGTHMAPYGALALAALQGRETEVLNLIAASGKGFVPGGDGMGLAVTQSAKALLFNGLGRYQEALAVAEEAGEHPAELWSTWALPELIEAAARSGLPTRGAEALRRLSVTTRLCGTDWGLGIEARSRALLSENAAPEPLYLEAIDRLGRTRFRVALARTRLLYGEWLRRRRRRLDARTQLRIAHDMFAMMGMQAFTERAARELVATGETARKRSVETRDALTRHEAQVAELARGGLSNPEIAARLFISRRTVEYHLRKVFAKLDITSRHELRFVLGDDLSVQVTR